MKKEDLIRASVIIDCEGSIGYYEQKDRRLSKNNYFFRVQVISTNLASLQFLKNVFSTGKIHKRQPYYNTRKKSYITSWSFNASYVQALRIALIIHKYLVIKKQKALNIISHYKKKGRGRSNSFSKNGIDFDGKNFYVDKKLIPIEPFYQPTPSKLISATIIDCEGYVSFINNQARIMINMNNEKYLKTYISKILGGEVRRITSPSHKNPYFCWYVGNVKALKVALLLRDIIIEKRSNMERIINHYSNLESSKKIKITWMRKNGILYINERPMIGISLDQFI